MYIYSPLLGLLASWTKKEVFCCWWCCYWWWLWIVIEIGIDADEKGIWKGASCNQNELCCEVKFNTILSHQQCRSWLLQSNITSLLSYNTGTIYEREPALPQFIGAFGPTVSFWAITRCSLALQVAISNILGLNVWAGSSIAGSTTGPI